ncbi:MAG: M23 family metallopeptidase [Chitinophagaceae bacterium]
MRFYFLLFVVWLAMVPAFSQEKSYPQGYFRNPMGIPMELTANFGELRTNHWHMGLDIRTQARENLPVYAAAGGYIAYIGVRPLSFGRFIIINHPNGLSTLYAHLNDFAPAIESYVIQQQYAQQSWPVELKLNPKQFPMSKGQFLAYSGNTGGSGGPHLHFEIIDTKTQKRLNPLLFGFELKDHVNPVIKGLVLYDRSRTINGQSPRQIPIKKVGNKYVLASGNALTTQLSKLSFAVATHDQVSGSPNPNGVYSASIGVDGQLQLKFELDSIDYDQTGYMNAHIDYSHKKRGGAYYQHLSSLPGEASGAYHRIKSDGVLTLRDTLLHRVEIVVADAYGNQSTLNFAVKTSKPWLDPPPSKVKPIAGNPTHFTPQVAAKLRYADFEVDFPAMGIYDSLPIVYQRVSSPLLTPAITTFHQLNDPSIPVHLNFEVRLKPQVNVPSSLRNKVVLQRTDNTLKPIATTKAKKAVWEGDWVTAEFDDFGYFRAFVDTVAPVIHFNNKAIQPDTINISALKRIYFTPTDNFGVIKNFSATLNGEWVRFTNDKGKTWVYGFNKKLTFGVHRLTVSLEDLVGNTTTKTWWIKKAPYTPPVKKTITKKKK